MLVNMNSIKQGSIDLLKVLEYIDLSEENSSRPSHIKLENKDYIQFSRLYYYSGTWSNNLSYFKENAGIILEARFNSFENCSEIFLKLNKGLVKGFEFSYYDRFNNLAQKRRCYEEPIIQIKETLNSLKSLNYLLITPRQRLGL